ncbi:hypothetical protein DIS18_00965 [Algibacter marinivivus]|uniref:tRNA_anti-like n=1 Tax=Algibacter marinivivus TaxID=2100723 RepID=A0A2U2X5T8_9FLAO|nr:hypothetical protein [Algibacter marinivivus]PWH83156.1 hypothetical protein DIS18_00965 [Algibacter marinivivus]
MKKKIIFFILLLVVSISLYNYVYQDHRNIETELPEFKSTPEDIVNEFKLDALVSGKKYLNKTIELTGIVTELNNSDLTLNNTIFCQFTETQTAKLNSEVKIKGRCIGYDDLFEQVKLDQCSIIK